MNRDDLLMKKAILLKATEWSMEVTEGEGKDKKKVLNEDGTVKIRAGVSITGYWKTNIVSVDKDPDNMTWGMGVFNFTLPIEKSKQAYLFPAVYECLCEMKDVADKDNTGRKTGKSHTEIIPVDIKCVGMITGINVEPLKDEQLLYDYSKF